MHNKHEMDKLEIINKILQQKQEIKILEALINQSQKNRVKQMIKNKNDATVLISNTSPRAHPDGLK